MRLETNDHPDSDPAARPPAPRGASTEPDQTVTRLLEQPAEPAAGAEPDRTRALDPTGTQPRTRSLDPPGRSTAAFETQRSEPPELSIGSEWPNDLAAAPAPPRPAKSGWHPALPLSHCLPAGTTLLRGQYRIDRFLGAGGFGITYLALDSLDRMVVIKECFPEALCRRRGAFVEVRRASDRKEFDRIAAHFEAEARRLAHLSHRNIVGVHQVFADNGTAYFALDLIRGQDLATAIAEARVISAPKIKELLLRLLDALSYLHERGILHRDIAPDNILLRDSGEPVLIDFGAARGDSRPGRIARTVLNTVKDGYSPPELYRTGAAETPACDLYALAATFYHLITGAAPPDAPSRAAAIASSAPDPYVPLSDFDRRFDRWFVAALNSAMSLAPARRPAGAQDWIEQIHEAKRRSAALAKAREDRRIVTSISRLVSETNLAVIEDQRAEQVKVAEAPLAAPPDPPAPPEIAPSLADVPPEAPPPEPPPAALIEPPVPKRSRLGRFFAWLWRLGRR